MTGVEGRYRWAMLVVVSAVLVSCGDDQDGPIDTAEECEDAGGRVVANPGNGVQCAPNEEKIADLPIGIEPTGCCRPR
jgi:hypothetical protein